MSAHHPVSVIHRIEVAIEKELHFDNKTCWDERFKWLESNSNPYNLDNALIELILRALNNFNANWDKINVIVDEETYNKLKAFRVTLDGKILRTTFLLLDDGNPAHYAHLSFNNR